MAYLNRLTIDEVKIDRSFGARLVEVERSMMVVRSIVELGHNLGFEVVAEGVEDRRTLDALVELGCDRAQGFFIGRPVPAEELTVMPGALGAFPRATPSLLGGRA